MPPRKASSTEPPGHGQGSELDLHLSSISLAETARQLEKRHMSVTWCISSHRSQPVSESHAARAGLPAAAPSGSPPHAAALRG